MEFNYDLTAERAVMSSGYCHYKKPSKHPDRVMDCHDFIYMIDGEWGIGQDGEDFHIHPGDVMILSAYHHHYPVGLCRENTRTIFFHCTVSDRDFSDSETSLPVVIPTCHDPRIRRLFDDIVYFYSTSCKNKDVILSSLLKLVFCELNSLTQSEAVSDPLVNKTIRTFQKNPSCFIGGDELANEFSVSERTIRNSFLKSMGKTPMQFQTEQKLLAIRSRLANERDITLHELAEDYGFCDEFYLSKLFKKQFGITPSAFRKNNTK